MSPAIEVASFCLTSLSQPKSPHSEFVTIIASWNEFPAEVKARQIWLWLAFVARSGQNEPN
jgi:hypothetical protein